MDDFMAETDEKLSFCAKFGGLGEWVCGNVRCISKH
jgi:hypothetical protein